MVKLKKDVITKSLTSKGSEEGSQRASKINASTPFGTCAERLSPFGGLLGLIKFLDLVRFDEIFSNLYVAPRRKPNLGHYRMINKGDWLII